MGIDLETGDQRGWILGPKETKEVFEKRVRTLDHFFSHPPQDVDHFLTDTDWKGAQNKLESIYDFKPDWIVAHFSNRSLAPFQGAVTWISQKGEIPIPLIQIRKSLEGGSLFKVYTLEEILSHEAVHAARMAFDGPRFEEILAYRTSKRWFIRFFGPIFERPWEAGLFIALLFVPIVLEITQMFTPLYSYWQWLSYLPWGFFAFLLIRLLLLQSVACLARHRLNKWLKNPHKGWAVLLRLTDREIFTLALSLPKNLEWFLRERWSLRWKTIKQKYFS